MSTVPSYAGFGTVNIDVAGTQEPLSTTSIPSFEVIVTAVSGNAGNVFVGDSTVSSTTGIVLAAGDSVTVPIDDVAKLWVDSAQNNDDVSFFYTAPYAPNVVSPLYAG